MPQYLVALYRPAGYDPSTEDEAMHADISALNKDMVAAGVRVFVGGLSPPSEAKSVHPATTTTTTGGGMRTADGPLLDGKAHMGGFWILEVPGEDDAVAWAKRAGVACRAAVEVRAVHQKRPS